MIHTPLGKIEQLPSGKWLGYLEIGTRSDAEGPIWPIAQIEGRTREQLMQRRRGGGSELSEEYFRDGVRYLRMAETDALAPTLFDLEGMNSSSEGLRLSPKKAEDPAIERWGFLARRRRLCDAGASKTAG